MVGTGLLTSEGEFRLRQRRLAQPAFHRDRLAAYSEQMVILATRTAHGWRDGATVDMHEEMMHLTLAVVSKMLCDANVDAESHEIGEVGTTVLDSFVPIMLPFAELDEPTSCIIAARRASGEDRGDLPSMLLHATDAEGDGTGTSDTQWRDEVLTIFLAGHERTANVLTLAWQLLSEHPEVAARLHAEVDALGHVPTIADLPRLGYMRQVVAETMRLCPPADAIGRRALKDYRCGDYVLRKGTIVLVLPWLQ